VADQVFLGDRVVLTVRFGTAWTRLAVLARDGVLLRACRTAYDAGMADLAQAAGPAARLSRLAAVRLTALADTDHCARLALRWEALTATGERFLTLDADLMLTPAGEQITLLAMTGTYRPPPGWAGAGLDRVIVRRSAAAAIRMFMARIACALVHPAGAAGPADASPPRRPREEQEP
jgi:hypothetical protein